MASADQLLSAALAQHRAGNLAMAEQLYRQLIAEAPNAPDAWHLLGTLYVQAERHAEAVAAIERAIQLNPTSADYYSHLGAAYSGLGQHERALENLQRAVRLAPQSGNAHYNLGTAQRNANRLEDAVVSFRRAVAADPSAAEAHYNLGNAFRDLKRYQEAETSYHAALAARPNYLKAMLNLAGVLNELPRRDEAIALLEQAVALAPQHARAHLSLGSVLRDAGQFERAVDQLELSIKLDPLLAEAHNNLGTAYQTLARFDEADACYQRALELDPELPDAHFSRATQLLREGNLQAGFAEYHWRWKCRSFGSRNFSQPQWQGEPLDGRTILLFAEQGLGDTLQFVRFASQVKARGATVIVECQGAVERILATCPGIDRLLVTGSPLPGFDVYCPLMSLPGVLRLTEDQLWQVPYLAAEPPRVARWKAKLAEVTEFRVGLCWQGNKQHVFDCQRSFPLAALAPVAQVPGIALFSLQKGDGAEQIASCPFAIRELGPELDADAPFVDTAAVIEQLDLVIAADTAITHLAGALGADVWLPLSAHSDWRWLRERDDSPWYPGVRLFRQQRLNDWDDVFSRLARALAERVASSSS